MASPHKLSGALTAWVEDLDPGYFSLVMATGIVSIGAHLFHRQVVSVATMWVTGAGFFVLGAAYVSRALLYPGAVRRSFHTPAKAMAYFTLVAGTNVAATRALMAGWPEVGAVLAALGLLLWAGFSYGLPWSLMVGRRRPHLGDINGTWLIWVVATQSVAVVAGELVVGSPWAAFHRTEAVVAVLFWSVGVMLYLVLIVIIFLRLFLVELTPEEMGPPYWIAMGATAISVKAAAGILAIRSGVDTSLLAGVRPAVVGASVMLWAFGTWWIPMLVLFGVWRHLLRHFPLRYEPRLWSVVFPLGMYTVASAGLGAVPGLGFMGSIAGAWLWVGVAAWVGAAVLMVGAALSPAFRSGGGVGVAPQPGSAAGARGR
ncbi:MAG: tellurite resistance/C4-dicarboxylate transporter family protein [Actinomycetota bacterium]|nr:tellurite resistance/C4-dicarboxylate transporter family protein [Actinomycetota bacterium]